ncbi:MAG: hypothetical protein UU71_C0014G0004 [Parcubacteria group bacterium GW2011_GWB1_41_6]|nr:MAG: hypothetical protein UU71_C0014G0004 [Parcubacteria group bacterium GW2011_GWB1_41_6]KKS72219.1 MAG: hypothetical protein UV43_C0020G0006 [Parcubacteria group bacterium GW2011_GWF2_42_7]
MIFLYCNYTEKYYFFKTAKLIEILGDLGYL